ncbi:hypothetical protein D3C77_461540 [compost metagenome]
MLQARQARGAIFIVGGYRQHPGIGLQSAHLQALQAAPQFAAERMLLHLQARIEDRLADFFLALIAFDEQRSVQGACEYRALSLGDAVEDRLAITVALQAGGQVVGKGAGR